MGHLKKWAKKIKKSAKKHLGLDGKESASIRSAVLSSNANSARSSKASVYGRTGSIVGRY